MLPLPFEAEFGQRRQERADDYPSQREQPRCNHWLKLCHHYSLLTGTRIVDSDEYLKSMVRPCVIWWSFPRKRESRVHARQQIGVEDVNVPGNFFYRFDHVLGAARAIAALAVP